MERLELNGKKHFTKSSNAESENLERAKQIVAPFKGAEWVWDSRTHVIEITLKDKTFLVKDTPFTSSSFNGSIQRFETVDDKEVFINTDHVLFYEKLDMITAKFENKTNMACVSEGFFRFLIDRGVPCEFISWEIGHEFA